MIFYFVIFLPFFSINEWLTDVLFKQSSQESPEDVFHRQNRGRPARILDDSEVVYIGEHRLSPIRRNITEAIDTMYDQDNDGRPQNYGSSTSSTQLSNTLPAR
jgi:hypothetical protein